MAKETEAAAPKIKEDVLVGADTAPERAATKRPRRLLNAEHAIMTHVHYAEIGESFEDFLEPSVWAHVASTMRVGHEIIVKAADGTWRGHLEVRGVGRVEAHVAVISFVEFKDAVEVADDTPYHVMWRGPSAKWSVLTKVTNDVVRDQFDSKDAAAKWISGHMKALAA